MRTCGVSGERRSCGPQPCRPLRLLAALFFALALATHIASHVRADSSDKTEHVSSSDVATPAPSSSLPSSSSIGVAVGALGGGTKAKATKSSGARDGVESDRSSEAPDATLDPPSKSLASSLLEAITHKFTRGRDAESQPIVRPATPTTPVAQPDQSQTEEESPHASQLAPVTTGGTGANSPDLSSEAAPSRPSTPTLPTAVSDVSSLLAVPSATSMSLKSARIDSLEHSHMDMSHVDGDIDVIRGHRAAASSSWVSSPAWSTLLAVALLVLLFAVACARRFAGMLRIAIAASNAGGVGVNSTESRMRRGVAALFAQLRDFKVRSQFGSVDYPSSDRTRELALLPFEDSTRRRGVKAGLGTKSSSPVLEGSDLEMQSLTASLSQMHIPNMIYLDSLVDSLPADALADSCILTPQRLQQLLPYLPAAAHVQDISLQYKLSTCGASIQDLYRRCGKMQDGSITVIQDSSGYVSHATRAWRDVPRAAITSYLTVLNCSFSFLQVFGCYVSSPWRIHSTYYGGGESFVFSLHPTFHVYPSASVNTFYQLATPAALAIGGGDHFAIWLDDALRQGQSKPCQTFASPSISSEEDFRCNGQPPQRRRKAGGRAGGRVTLSSDTACTSTQLTLSCLSVLLILLSQSWKSGASSRATGEASQTTSPLATAARAHAFYITSRFLDCISSTLCLFNATNSRTIRWGGGGG